MHHHAVVLVPAIPISFFSLKFSAINQKTGMHCKVQERVYVYRKYK